MNHFDEINDKLQVFTSEAKEITKPEALDIINDERMPILFNAYLQALEEADDLRADSFKAIMKSIQKAYKKEGIKGKYLWMPLRLALTGDMHGPELLLLADCHCGGCRERMAGI